MSIDPPFDLTGMVALVTGRSLGLAMVRAFAAHGADVIIASRKIDNCELAAAEVRALGNPRRWLARGFLDCSLPCAAMILYRMVDHDKPN